MICGVAQGGNPALVGLCVQPLQGRRPAASAEWAPTANRVEIFDHVTPPTFDGNGVVSWAGRDGAGTLLRVGSTRGPTATTLDGVAAVDFDASTYDALWTGTDRWLGLTDYPVMLHVLADADADAGTLAEMGSLLADTGLELYRSADDTLGQVSESNPSTYTASPSLSAGPHLFSVYFASATSRTVYVDGNAATENTTSVAFPTVGGTFRVLSLGYSSRWSSIDAARARNGAVGAFAVYTANNVAAFYAAAQAVWTSLP